MLKILSSGRDQKLVAAITQGDLEKLAKLLPKYKTAQLDAPLHEQQNAVELAICAGQAKALELLLGRDTNANGTTHKGQPFILLALEYPDHSLALITQLLRHGAYANTPGVLNTCFRYCNKAQLMMHLSRLIEHGCDLCRDPELMPQALVDGRPELLHFLINSGATLPETKEGIACSDEAWAYAKRCEDDVRIRQMMQPF